MNNLSLALRPALAASLDDCVRDACALAATLGLRQVTFEGNGESYVCYSDGTAQRYSIAQANGRDAWDGSKWSHVPPGSVDSPRLADGAVQQNVIADGAVIEKKGRREMTIEEVKAKRIALQSMLYTAFKEFERETGVIIDSVDVRHIDLSTIGGPHVLTPEVRVQLKWD